MFFITHPPPILPLVILLHPCSALAVTVDELWAPLSGLWELGRGVLLTQSSHLIQNEGAGARPYQLWCEGGGSPARVSWMHLGCSAPKSSLVPAFPTDHCNLGRGAAGMCAERGGPQPRLETLAGGREVVSGKLGEDWERGLQLGLIPLPKSDQSPTLLPAPLQGGQPRKENKSPGKSRERKKYRGQVGLGYKSDECP